MIYVTFERGGPKSAHLGYGLAVASVESKMATKQLKIFCVREFMKTASVTAVQRAFRLRFNIQPPIFKLHCEHNQI